MGLSGFFIHSFWPTFGLRFAAATKKERRGPNGAEELDRQRHSHCRKDREGRNKGKPCKEESNIKEEKGKKHKSE